MSRASIHCTDYGLFVNVHWTKTIQFGQRELVVPICSIPGSRLCPVQAYKRLVHFVQAPSSAPAFGYFDINSKFVPLTYKVFVLQFRKWLMSIGVTDVFRYCSPSFRRGGATFAFQCGVDANLIKAQGDWHSDCYLNYIKLDVKDKLVTTRLMSKGISEIES